MEDLKKKAIDGAFWSATGDWSAQLISLAVFTLLAKLLSPEVFGLVALANVYIFFAQVFANPGISEAIIQKEKLDPEHLDTAFWATLVIAFFLTGSSIMLAKPLAWVFDQAELAMIVIALSPALLLFSLTNVQQAILRRGLRFKSLGLCTVMSTVSGGGAGIILAWSGFGVWSLVAQQLVGSVTALLVLWRVCDWRPGIGVTRPHAQALFAFGRHVFTIRLLGVLNQRLDQLLIGYFLGTLALGYYSVAQRIFKVLTQLLVEPAAKVAFPTFSRMQSDMPRLRNAFRRTTEVTFAIATPAFVGLMVVAPDLVPSVFGAKWSPIAPILQFFGIIGILLGLMYFINPTLLALGQPGVATAVVVANTIGNVVAFAVTVRWGILAVAAGFAVRAVLFSPVTFWVFSRLVGLDRSLVLRHFLRPGLAACTMAGAVLLVPVLWSGASHPGRLVTEVGIGMLVYSLILYLLDRNLCHDILALRKAL